MDRDDAVRDAEAQSTGIDSTGRRRAEEALRGSDRQTVDYLEGLLEGFVAYDGRWVMTYMNAAGERLLGRRREDVLGKTWHEAFPHAVGGPVDRMYQRVMQTRRSDRMEYLYSHYGPDRWFEISASPVATGGVAVYFRDISEPKRAERALRQSEERFRALAAMSSDWYWEQDEHFRFVDMSSEVQALAGSRSVSHIGKTRWELPHVGVSEEQWAEHRALLERHEPFRGFEYRRVTERGDIIWMSANGDPVFDADGRFKGYRGTGSNITKRKEAEEALREADRRKDEFLATLSHELRNPLAPLRNALHLARATGEGGPGARPMHDMMERQLNVLIRLVDDLLELSRITSGSFELQRGRVQVQTLVRNALETADPQIKAAGHRVSLSLPWEPLWVDGDAVRLAQVVANLLNNAARYTPRGGDIEVSARREQATVAIAVRDSGVGMAPEQIPRMFGMFNRGDCSSGLGVGLALSRRLAEMHGGTLQGRSEGAGKGAEFTVRLPLAAGETAATGVAHAAQPSLSGRRILVVDDNRDAAASLGQILASAGAEVRTAYDGTAAIAMFEDWRPDVALLDLGMPGMDGYGLARRLRQRVDGRPLSLIAVTGWGYEEDRRRSREAGFDHHLVKPADIGALQALLGSLR